MKKIVLLTALLAMASAGSAEAVFITGGLDIAGAANPNTGDWDTATAVNFGAAAVTAGTQNGDYAAVPDFTLVTMNSPLAVPPAVPVQIWTFTIGATTYSFTLTGVSSVLQPGNNTLTIIGSGTLSITGFDDTPGDFSLTAQQVGSSQFSFSASQAANPVPEPASVALLGLGLVGVAAGVRRKVGRKTN